MDRLRHAPPPAAAHAVLSAARPTTRSNPRPSRRLHALLAACVAAVFLLSGCGSAPPRRARPRGPARRSRRHLAPVAPTIEGLATMTCLTPHVLIQANHRSEGPR